MAEPREPLTERELEVVRLLATGISNKEIAAQLHVSPNTVRVHLRNIFTKLEAQSRTEVTMIAVRNGWVEMTTQAAPELPITLSVATASGEAAMPELALDARHASPVAIAVQPASPRAQPTPVAPNPQPLPSPALWQRMASVAALVAIVLLTILLLQRPAAEAGATSNDFVPADGSSDPAVVALPVESSRWHPRASIRTARTRPAVAVVGGNVYVIGGEIGRAPSSEVLVYDPRRDAWREAASKPTPVMNAGAAVIGNMLYVPGGATADSQATDRVEALNLTTGEWKVLPPLPLHLAGHAVVAFGDRLYVVGGRTLSGLNTTTLAFDVKSGRWTSLAPLPTPRSQLGAAVVNGRIYAVGGYDGRREYATCEYFQIATGEWAVCAPMTIPRGGLGLAQVGSTLFAVGGGLSGFIGFNERYDPNADKWTPFEMPEQRMGDWRYVGIASLSTEFYAIGGSTRSVPLADNYVYEVLNNRTFLPAFQSNKDQ
ncbi:MAG: LuxR family transcriptional regulator [Candidatus Roseilinea sp.]|nr:MAG: LuxR family transcriptional regulator [Candidatus Roseilinea sp.]